MKMIESSSTVRAMEKVLEDKKRTFAYVEIPCPKLAGVDEWFLITSNSTLKFIGTFFFYHEFAI